jgi:Leucine-rich repeat (LRR) protein
MEKLSSLQQLFIEGNNITTIPPELANIQNLQRIHIEGNPLTKIDDCLRPFVAAAVTEVH